MKRQVKWKYILLNVNVFSKEKVGFCWQKYMSLLFVICQAAQVSSPLCVRWTLWRMRPLQGQRSKSGGPVSSQWRVMKVGMISSTFRHEVQCIQQSLQKSWYTCWLTQIVPFPLHFKSMVLQVNNDTLRTWVGILTCSDNSDLCLALVSVLLMFFFSMQGLVIIKTRDRQGQCCTKFYAADVYVFTALFVSCRHLKPITMSMKPL